MKLNKLGTVITLLSVATLFDVLSVARSAVAVQLFGLTDNNTIVSFDSDNPTSTSRVGVTGIEGSLSGIDFRPANSLLYGVTTANKIYTIDPTTGAANFVSTLSFAFNGGFESGVDFNPVPDRLRLVASNDQNLRFNVDNGLLGDFDANTPGVQPDLNLAYAQGDPNAGANPNVTAAAYTNSFPGGPSPTRTTTLFGIDSNLDVLVRQNPPNNGVLGTVGSLGIDFGPTGGFDIFSPANNVNTAFAASGSTLYTINLSNGSATTLGTIGSGDDNIIGLAAKPVPEPATVGSLIGFGALALLGRSRRRVKSVN
jgi:hypothetical protein